MNVSGMDIHEMDLSIKHTTNKQFSECYGNKDKLVLKSVLKEFTACKRES